MCTRSSPLVYRAWENEASGPPGSLCPMVDLMAARVETFTPADRQVSPSKIFMGRGEGGKIPSAPMACILWFSR